MKKTELLEAMAQAGFNEPKQDGNHLVFQHSEYDSLVVKAHYSDPEWFVSTDRCMFICDTIRYSDSFLLMSRDGMHVGHIWCSSQGLFNK